MTDRTVESSETELISQESEGKKPSRERKPEDDSIGIFDIVQSIVTAVFFGIMIFIFIFHITSVDGNSMYETLHHSDKLFTSNLFYTPKQGDIIILRTEVYGEPLVKRVIATAGQTLDIDFDSGRVYVDGEVLDEPYIYEPTHLRNGFTGPVTVPEGMLFCMGDNRNNSNDSRLPAIGFIDCRAVLGKVYLILIPGKDVEGKRDWSRFGSVY
ncbi:MAG: signal peptidase I [Oscillospiraceae bacterium]|nr:signal peptidase I [Oscillospiraceae bacterium]